MKNRITILRISQLVAKTLARILLYFSIFLIGTLLLFQISPVQTYITSRFLEFVSEKTNYEVSLSSVQIEWLDRAELNDLLILDKASDTLLYADQILLNYRFSDVINQEFLSVEEISSNFMKVQLIRHDSTAQLNLIDFVNSLKNTDKKKQKPILISDIELNELDFSIEDKTKNPRDNTLDFGSFEMGFSRFQLADFRLSSDSIDLKVVELSGREERQGLDIVTLKSDVSINSQSLSLTKLKLVTPTSQVSDSIKLYYNGLSNLNNFVDSVSFAFYLSDSRISQKDLSLFVGRHGLQSSLAFDGVVWGTVGDFNMEQARIGFGAESFIEGGISCFGLPDLKSTFALADIVDSHLIPSDLEPYVGKFSKNVEQLGRLDFTGSFAGFLNDFVARGDFFTEKGSVHSDINLKIPDDPNNMKYSGNLELREVDLGAFLNKRNIVQKVNLKGTINGHGITTKNANFKLNAVSYNSGIKGYVYDTIRADGTFASNFFEGDFSIEDPNCQVRGSANLDFNLSGEMMRVDLDIDSVDLNELHLAVDTIVTGGKVSIDIVNLDIDKFTGLTTIDSAFVRANNKEVLIDSVTFRASLVNDTRKFELELPGFKAELEGQFKIADAIKDVTELATAYASKIQLKSDSVTSEDHEEGYKIELFAQIDNLSRYLDSLDIPVEISNGSFIEASFRESKNTNLFVYAQADYVKLGDHTLFNPTLEANGSQDIEKGGILTNFILESENQEFEGVPATQNLLVEGVWYDNEIDFTTSLMQEETNSNIRIESKASITADSIILKMEPSNMVVFGDQWEFNPENQIVFYADSIQIDKFGIHDDTESIKLQGVYAPYYNSELVVDINQFSLNKVNIFTETSISGLIDSNLNIFRKSSAESFQFDGGFLVSNLMMEDFLVGNVSGTSRWDPKSERIYSTIGVDRENFKAIDLRGYYYPLRKSNQLDFDLKFDQADLRLAKPLLKEHVSNVGGFANGEVQIDGSLSNPSVVGQCQISEGTVTIDYLNTTYKINGNVGLTPGKVNLRNLQLIDRKGSSTNVTGSISHSSFSKIVTNIQLDANNFEFLNTTALDNDLYYGSANGTGTITISGPLNDLIIKATVKTEKDTRFFIPITEGGDIAQQEYIAFVDFKDTTQVEEKVEFKFRGLTLDFEIEVTPDAYCELIFDIKTGDIIRGRGSGNIKLTLDTDGEFHMFGPLEIIDGAYNFTVPGFINKEFIVSPGSRITWFGDPYNANIDLTAVYLQRADFLPLASEGEEEDQFSERVGMNVILKLSEGMLAPEIDFNLEFADKIDATRERSSKISQIVANEQELKRQVISLLFFRKFSPLSSFTLGGGGNVGNSVSEFFSNQVSYLVSQLDENLEVEVDLASLSGDAFNTFQLRLAYTFLDGRLKVSRGGDFANEQGTNDRVLEDIVGDWSVEYSLTKDGRLRAKVFRSTNQQISASRGVQNFDTGLSLRFVHSFNEFKDLLTSRRNEAIRKREEVEKKEKAAQDSNLDATY